jgi:hypothetical protein
MTTPAPAPDATPNGAAFRRAARKAPLAGPDKIRNLRIRASVGRRAELVVMRTGLSDWFERRLPARENRPTGGPKRALEVRALLVGMLLLVLADQPLFLRDVAHLLNELSPSQKHRLNIPRGPRHGEPRVSERMVSTLFNAMIKLIDPSPYMEHNREPYEQAKRELVELYADHPDDLEDALTELRMQHEAELAEKLLRLQFVLDAGVEATLPDDLVHTGSYAIDSTPLASWADKYRAKRSRAHWLHPDPDARRRKKPTRAGDSGWLGYAAHAIVRVPEVGGQPVPCLNERLSVTAADVDDAVAGLDLVKRMCADHERLDALAGRPNRPRRDIVSDRGYTPDVDTGRRWAWPLFDMGFDAHFDLTTHQLGEGRTPLANGGIVIDGQAYSPSTPLALRNLRPPPIGSTRAQIQRYQEDVAERAKYALHAVGGRHDDGSWDFGCRAMAALGQLICNLKPASLALPLTDRRTVVDPTVFQPRVAPDICSNKTTSRVGPEELPFWQPLLHGSREHYVSMNRRNRVEGYFGNNKNSAAQDINRGNMRVMGLAKTSFMTMLFVMAANMRLLDSFTQGQEREAARAENPQPKQRRQPRYRTRKRREMADYLAERAAQQQRIADEGLPEPEPPPDPDQVPIVDLDEPPAGD